MCLASKTCFGVKYNSLDTIPPGRDSCTMVCSNCFWFQHPMDFSLHAIITVEFFKVVLVVYLWRFFFLRKRSSIPDLSKEFLKLDRTDTRSKRVTSECIRSSLPSDCCRRSVMPRFRRYSSLYLPGLPRFLGNVSCRETASNDLHQPR